MKYLLCYLFGHTGNFTESGYHVCSRCGLHEYWCSRMVDPETPIDYDRAGLLVNWFYRWRERRRQRRWERDNSELPF